MLIRIELNKKKENVKAQSRTALTENHMLPAASTVVHKLNYPVVVDDVQYTEKLLEYLQIQKKKEKEIEPTKNETFGKRARQIESRKHSFYLAAFELVVAVEYIAAVVDAEHIAAVVAVVAAYDQPSA